MKRLAIRGLSAIFLCVFLGAAALALLARSDETWARRVAYVPRLAETALRKLRPVAELPTPPPASADNRARLLALPPLAPPTLPAPAVEVFEPTRLPAALGPTPTLMPTAAPTATPEPVGAAQVALTGVQHAYQTWNNCGPVTVAMNRALRALPRPEGGSRALKPDADDKTSARQIVAYARSQGFEGIIRTAHRAAAKTDQQRFPVIVEDWVNPKTVGHRPLPALTGYDQAAVHRAGLALWSEPGADAGAFDASWRVFNRNISSSTGRNRAAAAVLGEMASDQACWPTLPSPAETSRSRGFRRWFNLGSTYTLLGENGLAASAYDEARRVGLPFRLLWYQEEPFAAYLGAQRYEDVIRLAEVTLNNAGEHEEAYYYLGLAYQATDRQDAAARALQKALDYNPNLGRAAKALQRRFLTGSE